MFSPLPAETLITQERERERETCKISEIGRAQLISRALTARNLEYVIHNYPDSRFYN
jgi:hypothetical protein